MFENLDFKNDFVRAVFWVISFFSWISFLVTGFIGFLKLIIKHYDDSGISYNNIWSFMTVYDKYAKYYEKTLYLPIEAKNYYYSIIFLIILISGLVAFLLFLIKTFFQRDQQIYDEMMGTFTRFHFIPLICGTCLFLSGIFRNSFIKNFDDYSKGSINGQLAKFVSDLIFSIFGLFSLVFIKFQIKTEQPFYIMFPIKNIFFSCLIALFTYSIFYSSVYVGQFSKIKRCMDNFIKYFDECMEIAEDLKSFSKNCAIAFSLMIGLINLAIGAFLKDILIPSMNFIIYLGLTIFYYSIKSEDRKKIEIPVLEGIFDIVMLICSIAVLSIIIFLKIKVISSQSSS